MNSYIDKKLYEEIKSGTNIVEGEEYKQIVYAISQLAADMVVKTLGPYGKTTIIDDSIFTYPSKDGWASINRLRFADPIHNTIFSTIKQISFSVVNKVGDGTTSALIGANAFLKQILEYQENYERNNKNEVFRQSEFLNMLEEVTREVTDSLLESDELQMIDKSGDYSDINRIASISSNGNVKLSNIIQDIYKKTQNPNIYVSLDKGSELTHEIQTGYRFDCRALNHKAYVNTDVGTCEKKDTKTLVAIFDHNVSYNEHGEIITALSKYANAVGGEIIIIAPHFDDITANIIGTMVNHFVQQNKIPNIMLLQFPMSMEIHRQYLADVVMLTNAQVFDYGKVRAFNVMTHNATRPVEEKIEDALLNVDQYNFDTPTDIIEMCLGMVKTMIIDDTFAIIRDYESVVNPKMYKETLKEVEERYEMIKEKANKNISTLDKEYMNAHQRYIKLLGNMGVIKVGGSTELEKHCLKDSVDDATLACRSAFENGYIRGLNLSTLSILSQMRNGDNSQLKGDVITMLINVFREMTLSVMENKIPDSNSRRLVNQVAENGGLYDLRLNYSNNEIIDHCIDNRCGYNLVTETLETFESLTVVNSVSTDIEILKAIVGILSLILTSNQFLSVNRMYDRNATRAYQMNRKKEDNRELLENAINVLSENKDIIREILFSLD